MGIDPEYDEQVMVEMSTHIRELEAQLKEAKERAGDYLELTGKWQKRFGELEEEVERLRGLLSFREINTTELKFQPKGPITLEEWLTWFKSECDKALQDDGRDE